MAEQTKTEKEFQFKTQEESEYFSSIRAKIERAFIAHISSNREFNGKTLAQYYEDNEAIANTVINENVEEGDIAVASGTVEQKMLTLLSHVENLNIEMELEVYDEYDNELRTVAEALSDIVEVTKENDKADGVGDKEKRIQRRLEMMKHGTVFVIDEWKTEYQTTKVLNDKKYNGSYSDFSGYTEVTKKIFDGPSRSVLFGPDVLLGDKTKFYMDEQPFIALMNRPTYGEAKRLFGKFENFSYVTEGVKPKLFSSLSDPKTTYDAQWRLGEIEENQVEMYVYEDQFNDEFNVFINGVPMYPPKFPLSAMTPEGKYNVVKQVFRIINNRFSYGKSFVQSGNVLYLARLLDEMIKLSILKTRKSFQPTYVNMSGRFIGKKALLPGNIIQGGINANEIAPVAGGENQGVTAGEYNMLEKFGNMIDENTVSKSFTGMQAGRQQTATEIIELQRQAKASLGLVLSASVFLEKKLDILRLGYVMWKWFEPTSSFVSGAEGAREIINSYRRTTREAMIPNRGSGVRKTVPFSGVKPTPEEVRAMEKSDEEKNGRPVKYIPIDADAMKSIRLKMRVNEVAKDDSGIAGKRGELIDMINTMGAMVAFGSKPNIGEIENMLSYAYGRPKNKLFMQNTPVSQQGEGVVGAQQGMQPTPVQTQPQVGAGVGGNILKV